MPDAPELQRAKARRQQALGVIEDLELVERWGALGRPVLVGAVAHNLVVSNDIDLEVFVDGRPQVRAGFEIAMQLAEHPRVAKVRFTNALDAADQGLYFQFRYRASDRTDWKIDVWLLAEDHPGPLAARLVEPMRRALTGESRRRILTLKEARSRGEVGAIASIDIYRAVLDGNVSTPEALAAFVGPAYQPGLTDWLPAVK